MGDPLPTPGEEAIAGLEAERAARVAQHEATGFAAEEARTASDLLEDETAAALADAEAASVAVQSAVLAANGGTGSYTGPVAGLPPEEPEAPG